MEVKGEDLQREITHFRYKYKNRLFDKGQESWLPKVIDEPFDPYREKDFQRRKKEKFPPPLYPASIPTPEATPAQQKEREKYWR